MKTNTTNLSVLLILLIGFTACEQHKGSMEQWKQEIVDTEKAFAALALKEGIPTAFLSYAAEDAVLMRNNALGNENSMEGIFHTVWKRQEDGSWKFVWD